MKLLRLILMTLMLTMPAMVQATCVCAAPAVAMADANADDCCPETGGGGHHDAVPADSDDGNSDDSCGSMHCAPLAVTAAAFRLTAPAAQPMAYAVRLADPASTLPHLDKPPPRFRA